MMRPTEYLLYGLPVIITDRVKPGMFRFEGRLLVHPDKEIDLLDRMISERARLGYLCF